jgi:hypothetical protein
VAIIDGYFDRVPSVWHKEILWALERGIHVWGASSIGALRAAELEPFGMVGVGEVFARFRDGELTDDDEVAVVHASDEDGFRPLSSPMVDLRHRFHTAAAEGLITTEQAGTLESLAKARHYRERSLGVTLSDASAGDRPVLSEEEADRLRSFDRDAGPGLKRLDADALLDEVAAFADDDAFAPSWRLNRTVFFEALVNEVDRALAARSDEIDLDPTLPTWSGDSMAMLRKQTLLRVLARREADRQGLSLTADEVTATLANFRARYELTDDATLDAFLAEAGLSWEELVQGVADITMVDRIERFLRFEVDREVGRHLRLTQARRARDETPG